LGDREGFKVCDAEFGEFGEFFEEVVDLFAVGGKPAVDLDL
jgi:hypothetical protein